MRKKQAWSGCGGIILLIILQSAILNAQSARSASSTLTQLSQSFEKLSERVSPAVVQIFGTGYSPVAVGGSSSLLARQRSSGSGIILTPDGYVVTNAHVVAGARRVQVLLAQAIQAEPELRSILKTKGKMIGAQVVGIDLETDLAVLKIGQKGLSYLQLGDSDKLRPGQLVLAFGSPLGLENSVTLGVVSSVARQLEPEDPMIYIQTDAAINPGNSGGPLVDADGNVVGVNTLIFSQSGGSEGLGFAAPSNIVKNVFEQIKTQGRVTRGIIGVHVQTITPTLAAGLGLAKDWGVVIGDVYPLSPAALAGLKVGDIINSLDGKIIENGRQFDVNLYGKVIGEQVRLEITRAGRDMVVAAEVVERADDPGRFASLVTPEQNLIPRLGVLALEINEDIANMLPPLRKDGGVVVAARSIDAPHWEGGLYPGDVIYEINNKPVTSLSDIRAVLDGLKTYDPIVVQVERESQLMYIAFEVE